MLYNIESVNATAGVGALSVPVPEVKGQISSFILLPLKLGPADPAQAALLLASPRPTFTPHAGFDFTGVSFLFDLPPGYTHRLHRHNRPNGAGPFGESDFLLPACPCIPHWF